MRTTLNLDDDVAALIERVRKATKASMKEVVNAALREGLERMLRPTKFCTKVHSAGRCYLRDLDNYAEVLAISEGEQFK